MVAYQCHKNRAEQGPVFTPHLGLAAESGGVRLKDWKSNVPAIGRHRRDRQLLGGHGIALVIQDDLTVLSMFPVPKGLNFPFKEGRHRSKTPVPLTQMPLVNRGAAASSDVESAEMCPCDLVLGVPRSEKWENTTAS